MKKILLLLAVLIGTATATFARDTYAHDASALPKAAQAAIKNNFKAKVSVVKIDKDFGRISEYDAVLIDGTEISFDADGNWKDIEVANNKSVPASMFPASISQYVKSAQKGQRIVGIEKERGGFDVQLSNGIEMKFDKKGQFVRYDD